MYNFPYSGSNRETMGQASSSSSSSSSRVPPISSVQFSSVQQEINSGEQILGPLQPAPAPELRLDLPGLKFAWHALAYPIFLPATVQVRRACVFSAVARQVEYNIIIMHAKEGVRYYPSFNVVGWETEIRTKYPEKPNFEAPFLMTEIRSEEMNKRLPGEKRRRGVGLLVAGSHMKHWCDLISVQEAPTAKYMHSWIIKRQTPLVAILPNILPRIIEFIHDWIIEFQTPLVAVLPNIPEEYPTRSEKPYLNEKYRYSREQLLQLLKAPFNLHTHAVVLVGVYYPLGLVVENRSYFIFQSPNFPDVIDRFNDGSIKSLLPAGMSIVCSSLIFASFINSQLPEVVNGFNNGSIRSLIHGGMSIVCSTLIMQVSFTSTFLSLQLSIDLRNAFSTRMRNIY